MDMTYLIRFFLKNRVNRYVFSLLSRNDKEGKSILEDIFSLYVTGNGHLPFPRRLRVFPFYLFFEMGRVIFGQTSEDVKKELSSRTFQKGISLTMRSVAHYGLTYPQKFIAPPVVVWNFTNVCNLRCKHCYQSAGKKLPHELSLEKRLDVIDQLAKEDVFSIAFSGGEPLMDKDIWKVIKRAKENFMYVSVATNGTLITPQVAKRLSDVGVDYVEISLDSVNPEKHDEFRGVKGAWIKQLPELKMQLLREPTQ